MALWSRAAAAKLKSKIAPMAAVMGWVLMVSFSGSNSHDGVQFNAIARGDHGFVLLESGVLRQGPGQHQTRREETQSGSHISSDYTGVGAGCARRRCPARWTSPSSLLDYPQ